MIGQRGATRSVRVYRHRGGETRSEKDALAVEEPLEIRVSWVDPDGARETMALAVTMRTPGDDFDLVAGFLCTEGIVEAPAAIQELSYCRGGAEAQAYNVIEARLREGVTFDPERQLRNFYTSSSCGVCGKASLEAVEAQGCMPLGPHSPRVSGDLVADLPSLLEDGQGIFQRTGGLHAAGLFDPGGRLRAVREDVGRHNAVDKAVGHAFLRRRLPASEAVLVVSGRASFEIVQKSIVAGIPVLVAVGAPSSLAVELASRFGQTLVGFARDGGFNVYSGEERIA